MSQGVDVLVLLLCWCLFIYKWLIIISIVLTWVHADPHNPIVHWINKVTRPLWKWCNRWLPAPLKLFDAYIALLVVIFVQAAIPASIRSCNFFFQDLIASTTLLQQVAGHTIQGTGIVINSVLWFFIIILAIWFFLTLVSPSVHNPLVRIVYMLADPLITPIQRYMPRAKVDLSPIVGIFLFLFINSFLITPLSYYGASLSYPVRLCVF